MKNFAKLKNFSSNNILITCFSKADFQYFELHKLKKQSNKKIRSQFLSDWFLSVANQRLNNSCWQNEMKCWMFWQVALVGQRNWNEMNFFKSDKCSFVHLNLSLSIYLHILHGALLFIFLPFFNALFFCFYSYLYNDILNLSNSPF